MFAVEVSFDDGLSRPELLLVRRPEAIIGASDYAHLVIDELSELGYQIKVWRKLGRDFAYRRIGEGVSQNVEECSRMTRVQCPGVQLTIFALDCDLSTREEETLDRASVRIARSAIAEPGVRFPAIGVLGGEPFFVSFREGQHVLVGRSNQCAVRLDSSEISSKHARFGFEQGEFWVEDLGSTNGTFLNQAQVAGRTPIVQGDRVRIGRETFLYPIFGPNCLVSLENQNLDSAPYQQEEVTDAYPAIVAVSSVARPGRIALRIGHPVVIGRDPQSEFWLGAPHVSRSHLTVTLINPHVITVQDHSTNGTVYDSGVLLSGESFSAEGKPCVLNFGGDLTVALCFSEEDEELFRAHEGAKDSFKTDRVGTAIRPGSSIIGTHVERTKRLYLSLSFPLKVLVVFVGFLFVSMLWVLIKVLQDL